MSANLENLEFGKTWFDVHIDRYAGYRNNMSDYHMHEYYEISLILSGEVKVLLPDTVHHGTECRLMLTGPMTPHLVICESSCLYRRVNLLFAGQFVARYIPEWKQLLSVFGKRGRVIPLSAAQGERFLAMIDEIEAEPDPFRRRLRLLLTLSSLGDLPEETADDGAEALPAYVSEALSYMQEHYTEKLTAAELAAQLHIGRTTLMTAFKHYTGTTLNDYLLHCRFRHALACLELGMTEQSAAERCGFGDASNLIRAFRRKFGKTPLAYLAKRDTSP